MEECGYCQEKENQIKTYLEGIENEKLKECIKALEREKIAKGMCCTKEDEKKLKQMQLNQIIEKQNIEKVEQDIDMMWHQVLIEDVRQKELKERLEEEKRQQDMLERRRAYDEQILSANRKRQEALREERNRENRRLERMKKKMEKDHYDAIKRKKEQQNTNKINYIEGHETKMSILKADKMKARDIDNTTIKVALEELQREKERNIMQMRNLQLEKKIFIENYNRERKIAVEMEMEAEKLAQEWKKIEEEKADENYRKMEIERKHNREKAAQEYKKHIETINIELERAKQERQLKMEDVKRAVHNELKKKLNDAKDEMRRQIEYRNSLTNQIRENQRFIESEIINTELKDKPFTKKSIMFREAIENTLNQKNVVRDSTNPVHPFRKLINKETQLPQI